MILFGKKFRFPKKIKSNKQNNNSSWKHLKVQLQGLAIVLVSVDTTTTETAILFRPIDTWQLCFRFDSKLRGIYFSELGAVSWIKNCPL